MQFRNLYALADRKKCFVKDLEDLSIEEFVTWGIFYEIERKEIEETHGR